MPRYWRHPGQLSKIDEHAHYVYEMDAGTDFVTPEGKTLRLINTSFHIWDVREEKRVSLEDSSDRGYFWRSTAEDYDLIHNPVGLNVFVEEILSGSHSYLKTAHPLVLRGLTEVLPAIQEESRQCYSSILTISKTRLRVHLNAWMDAHPAEKATVEDAIRASRPRALFYL